jgi:predicted transcriptional regulator
MQEMSRWLLDLCALGLTQYEAKVYLALMQRKFFTAAEVARVSTVPRQRIYDVLTSLFERGLVRIRQGGSMQYTAIDPQSAMERLIAERRAALESLETTTTQLLAALAPTWSDGQSQADPMNFIEVLRDPHMLAERLADLYRGARHRLLLLVREPQLTAAPIEQLRATERVCASGGEVRCVYEQAVLDGAGEDLIKALDVRRTAGEHARVLPTVPMGLCIVDDNRLLLSMRDPVAGSTSTTHVFVEHPELASLMAFSFDAVWSRGDVLETASMTNDAIR